MADVGAAFFLFPKVPDSRECSVGAKDNRGTTGQSNDGRDQDVQQRSQRPSLVQIR
jgi:hypothetical protein